MALFLFTAKTAEGKAVKGEVDASNEIEARVRIRAQKLAPIQVVPRNTGPANRPKAKASKPSMSTSIFAASIDAKELQVFTRQFATLIGAGVPVVQSLEAMMGRGRSPLMNATLKQMISEVGKGRRLAECMKEHPNVFDNMYVNLVHAGEEGGVLDTILMRLASYIEKSVKLRGKIKGALFYPVAVVVVAIIVVSGIMIFVIPSFVKMFQESGMALPYLTQLVIKMSELFVKFWYMVIVVPVGTTILLKQYYATAEGRKNLDIVMINIPLFGDLIRKGAVARFSRTLSTMLSAGVRIVEALDIAAATSKNWVIEQVLMQVKESISKGRSLSEPLRQSPHIPEMVAQMVSVGEQTGALDSMLDKVATFFEEEVEATAQGLTSVIEPLMMVVLGGMIAFLVVAMYLPVFSMAGGAGG